MISTLSIVGAGGHGRVIADSAAQMGCWDEIQFFDDKVTGQLPDTQWNVVSTLENALENLKETKHSVVVGIGCNKLRLTIQDKLEKADWPIATIIHPTAIVSSGAIVGAGTVVMANSVINIGARIGKACIVNTCSSIDHDCLLGVGVHVSPGATLSGDVTLGDRCWIGAGTTLIHGIDVGENTVIGAGSVVIRSVPDNVTCVGNPAKINVDI